MSTTGPKGHYASARAAAGAPGGAGSGQGAGWSRPPVYAVPVRRFPAVAGDENLVRGIELHDRAVDGDKGATPKAYDLLKAAHLAHPDDPVAEAYFGSATALLGRDAVDPDERLSKALRGLKILDRAVRRAPDNVRVRTVRAYVCYRLPEMYFHRTYAAVEDFSHLASLYEKDNSVLPEPFYWQILFDLGKAYQNVGRKAEAVQTWKKLLSVTRDPKYQELLRNEGVMDVPFDSPATVGGRPGPETKAGEEEKNPELTEGIRLHDQAVGGDAEAAARAYELLSDVCRKHPGNVLAQAYCASASSLAGKYSPDTSLMFENAIKAMLTLDRLVAENPDRLELRLLRGNQSYRLPEPFFRRTATAIADFEHVLSLREKRPDALPPALVHQVLYHLGACYERLGMADEAKAAWSTLLAEAPDPALRDLVQERLQNELGEVWAKPVSPHDRARLLEEGVRLHRLGVQGNRKAAKLANEFLAAAYALAPQDPLVQAYYGSSVALVGRYSPNPSEMFSKAVEGLQLLKKAAGKNWADPRIRLLRGYLCYALPDAFFHLLPRAIKDFRAVRSAYRQGDRTLSEATFWQVLYDLGCALKRAGKTDEARKVWQELLSVSPDPKFKALLKAEEVKMK